MLAKYIRRLNMSHDWGLERSEIFIEEKRRAQPALQDGSDLAGLTGAQGPFR